MTKLSDIFTDPCKASICSADECFTCEWAGWPFVGSAPMTDEEHEHQKHLDWLDEKAMEADLRRGG